MTNPYEQHFTADELMERIRKTGSAIAANTAVRTTLKGDEYMLAWRGYERLHARLNDLTSDYALVVKHGRIPHAGVNRRYRDEDGENGPGKFERCPRWASYAYQRSLEEQWEQDGSVETGTHVCWAPVEVVDVDMFPELTAGKLFVLEEFGDGRVDAHEMDSVPDLAQQQIDQEELDGEPWAGEDI